MTMRKDFKKKPKTMRKKEKEWKANMKIKLGH